MSQRGYARAAISTVRQRSLLAAPMTARIPVRHHDLLLWPSRIPRTPTRAATAANALRSVLGVLIACIHEIGLDVPTFVNAS
jgi:hypothetical protein